MPAGNVQVHDFIESSIPETVVKPAKPKQSLLDRHNIRKQCN